MKNTLSNDSSLVRLCKAHLPPLAADLRAQDKAEMWAAYRLPPQESLALCLQRSALALAFLYQGRVAAAAGVEPASLLGWRGCVWSWTGQRVEKCPKSFWKASLVARDVFKRFYPHLFAACDCRYRQAGRYLRRLGARPTGDVFYLTGKETRFELYRF